MTRVFVFSLIAALILLTGLGSLPAWSQDTADFGGTGCQLVPVAGATHIAEVLCRNVETTGNSWTEGVMVAGGLAVHLSVDHGVGDVPDAFTVTPPDGFFADPPLLVLQEDTRGVVLIFPWAGS